MHIISAYIITLFFAPIPALFDKNYIHMNTNTLNIIIFQCIACATIEFLFLIKLNKTFIMVQITVT